MAIAPTKPLFCARFSLLNTTAYTPAQIRTALEPGLKAAGYVIYQAPIVKTYTAKYRTEKEGPFEGDDAKSVYEKMYIMGPDGKETAISKDLTNDPMGTRPVLEQKKPIVTTVAWNLGPPAGATPQTLSDLLWKLRRETLYSSDKYTGAGWVPIVLDWTATPVTRANYPNRPALPTALTPAPAPKPAPVIKPPIKIVAPVVVPEPIPILVETNHINWKWIGIGAAGLLGLALLTSDK